MAEPPLLGDLSQRMATTSGCDSSAPGIKIGFPGGAGSPNVEKNNK